MTCVTALALVIIAAQGTAAAQTPAMAVRPTAPPPAAAVKTTDPHDIAELRRSFAAALHDRRFDDALQIASAWTGDHPAAGVLDEVSYQLVAAGAEGEAATLLLRRFPYDGRGEAEREVLVERLSMLLVDRGAAVAPATLAPVRVPMDTPGLRSRQAVMWTGLADCAAVRAVLGDLSPSYRAEDLMRLADCSSAAAPELAREAYLRVHQLQPGGRASRGLGYTAYALHDYEVALAAWQAVDMREAAADDVLAAVTTALAAQEREQAGEWLAEYARRGLPDSARYWALRGQQRMAEDPAGAAEALARAALLMPDDAQVQAALGFAYWNANETAAAVAAFERAWSADPANAALSMQLVYGHQRLGQNAEARRYAEHVLDGGALGADLTSPTAIADRRFGLQRLHEDLGRRVTLNFDGWSGRRVSTGTGSTLPGAAYNSYAQIDADLRLGRAPIRNGRSLSIYTRIVGDGGAGSALPSENPWLGAGVRWKPWGSQVLYLAVEAQSSLEDGSRHDLMLRASASFLNAGRYSDDWHPGRSGWLARNLYVDGAYYARGEVAAGAADYRMSYHKALAGSSSLEPYGHVQASVYGPGAGQRDARAGAGLRWNLWYGGSRYDAPPHKLSIGVEYQHAFETYLDERHGVFLAVNSRW